MVPSGTSTSVSAGKNLIFGINTFCSKLVLALFAGLILVGFGTFSKVRRKARSGRNPQTGAKIKIKARNAVKFKPGKALKDAV